MQTLERAVGKRVYERISELMGAKAGTPEGDELALLAALVADVEEYGFGLADSREPDPTKDGIFRDHTCWKCRDGEIICARLDPRGCEYPRARND